MIWQTVAADAALALSRISDGNFFMEVKSAFAPSMVNWFHPSERQHRSDCVANRSVSYDENGEKAAEYDAV